MCVCVRVLDVKVEKRRAFRLEENLKQGNECGKLAWKRQRGEAWCFPSAALHTADTLSR